MCTAGRLIYFGFLVEVGCHRCLAPTKPVIHAYYNIFIGFFMVVKT